MAARARGDSQWDCRPRFKGGRVRNLILGASP